MALKYGYDSPDSFARAFLKFHGITPSAAKEKGAPIRDFAPLKIILSLEGGSKIVCGMFGLCVDQGGDHFGYLIADLYKPWEKIPEGYETYSLPAGTWAVFPCKMSTLQDTNTKMWREWLPNCKDYKLGGSYNIEMYAPPCEENPQDTYCELWLPIEKL